MVPPNSALALVPVAQPSSGRRLHAPVPLSFSLRRMSIDYRREEVSWADPPFFAGPFFWVVAYGDDVLLLPALDGVQQFFEGDDATEALLFLARFTALWVGAVGPFARPSADQESNMGRTKQTARKSLHPPLPQFGGVSDQRMLQMERAFHGPAFRAAVAFFRSIAQSRRQESGVMERRMAFRNTMAATVTFLHRTFRAVTGRDPPAMEPNVEDLTRSSSSSTGL